MLGNLFVLFVFGVIAAVIVATVGDDIENLWRTLRSYTDPEHRKFRRLHKLTRK